MNRVIIVSKLCQNNSDCNEDIIGLSFIESLQESVIWIKECNEQIQGIKQKQEMELKKQQAEKKQQQQQYDVYKYQEDQKIIYNIPTSALMLLNIESSQIQIKFVRLKTGRKEDRLDFQIQEFLSQLIDLGIHEINNNHKLKDFCGKLCVKAYQQPIFLNSMEKSEQLKGVMPQ
ncbi:unnamed protein product [Paramecium sonneborni]|uniref:Uncharacterized protein n=1 Tax=Paramecium sonneborni TaxID=65129 RepID=A0A8S1PE68_9CILI|nr:unnamed protein product [Paramecium sonneborni]